tara:strand:+ start:2468 stop:2752 length:285 start_codon:yes stop_codon:yes gene_type:complete
MTKINPIHPGEHLAEFIDEYGITEYRLAKEIHVPSTRINQIIKSKRGITADTAVRLGLYFGNTPQFWTNLQTNYDIDMAKESVTETITPISMNS